MTYIFPSDAADLRRYIETSNHALRREHVPVLEPMAGRVETVHSGDHHVPVGPANLLVGLIGDMEVQMKKAVLIHFAAIRKG
jgi:regulator of cell morphogenesis and NO signaling